MSQSTTYGVVEGENDLLPQYLTPHERHWAHRHNDMHRKIAHDDDYWDIVNGDTGLDILDSGTALIKYLTDGTCPLCGETGTLKVDGGRYTDRAPDDIPEPTFGLISGVSRNDDGNYPEAIDRLTYKGYYPVVCGANHSSFLVGLARRGAVIEYNKWSQQKSERSTFYKHVNSIRGRSEPQEHFGHGYSHGEILGAIYEELGAESYDERELMGRGSVTKSQLFVILERIKSLETQERRDFSEDDWLIQQDFGVTNASVEFHYPEWVNFEGLNYSDHYRTTLYDVRRQ